MNLEPRDEVIGWKDVMKINAQWKSKAHYTSGLESLLEEYGRTPEPPKEPDYNSKEHRLAMAEEILFGEKPLEVLIGKSGGFPCWEHSRRRDAMSSLYDGGFVRIRP